MKLGNGLTRMLRFNVAKAVTRCGKWINKLGAETFLDEDSTAVVLGCSLADLNIMRKWTRYNLGMWFDCRPPKTYYENNSLIYHYRFENTRKAFKMTDPLRAVLAHDIYKIIGNGIDAVEVVDICEDLADLDGRPWGEWLASRGDLELGVRAITPKGISLAFRGSGIVLRQRSRGAKSTLKRKDLEPVLDRYPVSPDIDLTRYTRKPYYIQVGSRPVNKCAKGIAYKLGDIEKFLSDPWPVLIDRVDRSNIEIIYCVSSPYWSKGIVKIGYSDNRDNFTGRMMRYRANEVFPSNPIVHWAVEVPTRLVLEKRLHNLYLNRQVDSVGAGKSGGEMFYTSPKLYSPERMLRDAVTILEDTRSKHTVLDVDPTTYISKV